MNKRKLKPALCLFIAFCICQTALAQNDDINHVYFTFKTGTTSKLELSDRGNTANLESGGFTGGFGFGYKLNRKWSLEVGFIHTADFSVPGLIEFGDLDITSKYLIANYTKFINEGGYYFRLRGGIVDWQASASEDFVLLGWDLTSDEAAGPYENSGVSPIAGLELGYEFGEWVDWSIIGAESVFSGDAQWNAFYTSLKISVW